MVSLVQVHKDHSVPDGTPNGLRRPPRPPQTPVRPHVLIVVPRDDHRFAEDGHHQRVTGVGDRGDEVDEVPAGAVGGGHFSAEGAVVGWSGHDSAAHVLSPGTAGATHVLSLGATHVLSPGTAGATHVLSPGAAGATHV